MNQHQKRGRAMFRLQVNAITVIAVILGWSFLVSASIETDLGVNELLPLKNHKQEIDSVPEANIEDRRTSISSTTCDLLQALSEPALDGDKHVVTSSCKSEIFDRPDGGQCIACVAFGSGSSCTPCGGGFCTCKEDEVCEG